MSTMSRGPLLVCIWIGLVSQGYANAGVQNPKPSPRAKCGALLVSKYRREMLEARNKIDAQRGQSRHIDNNITIDGQVYERVGRLGRSSSVVELVRRGRKLFVLKTGVLINRMVYEVRLTEFLLSLGQDFRLPKVVAHNMSEFDLSNEEDFAFGTDGWILKEYVEGLTVAEIFKTPDAWSSRVDQMVIEDPSWGVSKMPKADRTYAGVRIPNLAPAQLRQISDQFAEASQRLIEAMVFEFRRWMDAKYPVERHYLDAFEDTNDQMAGGDARNSNWLYSFKEKRWVLFDP